MKVNGERLCFTTMTLDNGVILLTCTSKTRLIQKNIVTHDQTKRMNQPGSCACSWWRCIARPSMWPSSQLALGELGLIWYSVDSKIDLGAPSTWSSHNGQLTTSYDYEMKISFYKPIGLENVIDKDLAMVIGSVFVLGMVWLA